MTGDSLLALFQLPAVSGVPHKTDSQMHTFV